MAGWRACCAGLIGAGTLQVRKASGPPQRGKAAGWVPTGRCGESTFSLFALATYSVASQSTVIVQDMEIGHLFKDSYFCSLLKN